MIYEQFLLPLRLFGIPTLRHIQKLRSFESMGKFAVTSNLLFDLKLQLQTNQLTKNLSSQPATLISADTETEVGIPGRELVIREEDHIGGDGEVGGRNKSVGDKGPSSVVKGTEDEGTSSGQGSMHNREEEEEDSFLVVKKVKKEQNTTDGQNSMGVWVNLDNRENVKGIYCNGK
ncbi:hypothetical protein L873DRAFT_1842394 [Choiromyces venosus 120613-1]|uniref:Uncharacterized protein n=1 Tax=Choiromyces venosus 120613-1 TaxID=1336337 RepID=A0A3N4JSU5_9PEZI|nr:hypothetical protein L873DRAFT_1842394 [Choiromyces venosus 120613-1]